MVGWPEMYSAEEDGELFQYTIQDCVIPWMRYNYTIALLDSL